MFWKVNLGQFEFKKKEYFAEFLGNLQDLAKQGAKEFIKVAALEVPIDTGMAQASLYGRVKTFSGRYSTVKEYLGLSGRTVAVARRHQPRDKKGHFVKREKWYYIKEGHKSIRDGYRTIPRGREMGLMSFDFNSRRIFVRWDTEVCHYRRHELKGDWRSREAGMKAFEDYVQGQLKYMGPELTGFVTFHKVSKR